MTDSDTEKENVETTPANDVVTKYKMGGEIVNGILKELLAKCVVGASVVEICEHGDGRLNEEISKVFKKNKELKKGMALLVGLYCSIFQGWDLGYKGVYFPEIQKICKISPKDH